jgi:hypothetical protein
MELINRSPNSKCQNPNIYPPSGKRSSAGRNSNPIGEKLFTPDAQK